MQRQFTKAVGRYKVDEVRDYPKGTWEQIARSAGRDLNTFTKPVGHPVEVSRKKVAREQAMAV